MRRLAAFAIGLAFFWPALAAAHDGEPGHTHGQPSEAVGDQPMNFDPPPAPDADGGADEGAAANPNPSGARSRGGRIPPMGRLAEEEEDDDDDEDIAPVQDQEIGDSGLPAAPEAVRSDVRRETLADTTWRQNVREREAQRRGRTGDDFLELPHFYFELRFGPYWPEVDEEFGGTGPYASTFGDKGRFYFGLEIDWLPLHIPYVASIGPGFGWGWTRSAGDPLDENGQPVTDADTSIWIMPMHLSGVVRFDGPLRRWNIPVVPYGKIGFGWGIWKSSGPTGTSSVMVGEDEVEAKGNSMGMHLALGGAIALNAFDPSSSIALRESTGIHYINLWGEWMWANLDGIGSRPQMHIGSSTVVVGLAVDF